MNNDPQICGVVERFFAMRKVGGSFRKETGRRAEKYSLGSNAFEIYDTV